MIAWIITSKFYFVILASITLCWVAIVMIPWLWVGPERLIRRFRSNHAQHKVAQR